MMKIVSLFLTSIFLFGMVACSPPAPKPVAVEKPSTPPAIKPLKMTVKSMSIPLAMQDNFIQQIVSLTSPHKVSVEEKGEMLVNHHVKWVVLRGVNEGFMSDLSKISDLKVNGVGGFDMIHATPTPYAIKNAETNFGQSFLLTFYAIVSGGVKLDYEISSSYPVAAKSVPARSKSAWGQSVASNAPKAGNPSRTTEKISNTVVLKEGDVLIVVGLKNDEKTGLVTIFSAE